MAGHAFDEGSRYRALKTLAGVRPFSGPAGPISVSDVTRSIGALLVARAQKCFVDQGRHGKPWPERSVPNVYGIIADLSAGEKIPAHRFQARPAGMDTGDLFRGIAYQLVGVDTVEVGVGGPASGYAEKVNDGGKTRSEIISPKVVQGLYDFLYGGGGGNAADVRRSLRKDKTQKNYFGSVPLKQAKGEMRSKLGFLFNKKFRGERLVGKIPARPFLALDARDTDEILAVVGAAVRRVA